MELKENLFHESQRGKLPLFWIFIGSILTVVALAGFFIQDWTIVELSELLLGPLIFLLIGAAEFVPRDKIKIAAALRLGSFCCILAVGLLVLRDVFV